MKAGDMYPGQSVAVKITGWERPIDYQRAKVIEVAYGQGHAQTHKVETEDGTLFHLHARRIMMTWQDYEYKYGEKRKELKELTEQNEFQIKARQQLLEMHVDQAERIVVMLQVLGIDSYMNKSYNWNPASDDAFGALVTVKHLDALQALVEPLVQAKLLGPVPPIEKADSDGT